MNIQITWAGLFEEIPSLDMGEIGFGWEVGHYSWMDTMCSLLEQHDFNEHPLECCKKESTLKQGLRGGWFPGGKR